jgi:cytosine/adenosine deaminase-related metal-dependent hydrolase
VGCRADVLVLDGENPALRDKAGDFIQDAMIFATNSTPVRDVYTGGCAVVRDFRAVSHVSD